MKRDLILVTAFILILMSTAGCSVVRFAENAAGYGVKRTSIGPPEIRRAQISRQDLQLGITATDSGLSLQLRFLPYYHLEQRQTFTSRAQLTGIDIAVGLASAGLLGWVAYDNWRGDGTYLISGDGSFKEGRSFDWEGAALWQKAIMLGVPADFAIAAILHTLPGKGTTPWQQKGEEKGTPQWLKNHPYRLELSGYDLGKDYRTSSGDETIAIREFLDGIKNPAPFLQTNTLQLRASTEFEGKPYTETLTLANATRLKPFRDFARAAAPEKETKTINTASEAPRPKTITTTIKETPPDPTPPTITLGTIPTLTAETQRITIQGSVTSNIGIQNNNLRIDNNGNTLPSGTLAANGGFAVSISLNEGNNQIRLAVIDSRQQRTEKIVNIYRPTMPPQIEVIEPQLDGTNAAEIQQPTQLIRVRVTDTSDIGRVTLNGMRMQPTPTKNIYALTSPAIISQSTFTIAAVDIHGSQNSKVFTLTYRQPDDTPPTITILQPVRDVNNLATIDTSPLLVMVEAIDESGIAEVKINGMKAADSGNNTFSRTLPYTTSLKQVNITATDTLGNTDAQAFRVVHQQKPPPNPVVTPIPPVVDTPPAERNDPRLLFTDKTLEERRRHTSNSAVFTLEFIVLDESPIKEVVVTRRSDGATYPVSKIGKRDYTTDLQLNEGENIFEIKATDQWNNHELETLTLTRIQADTEGPMFISLSVGEGIQVQKIPVRGGYLVPDTPIVVSNPTTMIRGSLIDDSGIASINISVNDKSLEAVAIQQGNWFQKTLPLDYGQNRVRVTATDTRGNTEETEFTLHQRPNRNGKDFALLFATNRYDGKKNRFGTWENLTTPIADAEKVGKKLRENYGFKTKIVRDPTGRELMNTIVAYHDQFIDEQGRKFSYEEGSQLLIYFAGHGYYNNKTEAGYLVTRESEPPDLDPAQSTAVEHSNLRRNIDLIKCNRVLVLMDTCFSGTFNPKYKPQTSAQMRSVVEAGTLLEQINITLKLTARWCLTSTGTGYVFDDRGKDGHSPFAAAFIASLDTNGGPDNLLRLDEIWKNIQESKNHPDYAKAEQNPAIVGLDKFKRPEPIKGQFGTKGELYEESDFLLFPKVK